VAAIGALFQHLARNELSDKLAGTGVSHAQQEQIVHGLGAGGGNDLPPRLSQAAHDAFIHAFSSGMWLSAGVAAFGVVIALWLIGPKAGERSVSEREEPAAQVEAAPEAVPST
jgi:hypothetical protein